MPRHALRRRMSNSATWRPQFPLGTEVRYHYVPKYTVFHVFFKIAVHWKELASSILCSNVGTSTGYDGWLQYSPTRRLRCPGYSEKLRKNCLFAHLFGYHVFPIFSTSITQISTKLDSLCQWAPTMPLI